MTAVLDPPSAPTSEAAPAPLPPLAAVEPVAPSAAVAPSGHAQVIERFVVWLLAVVVGFALVAYGFGPYFHQRDQRQLLNRYRDDIARAANEATGLGGVTTPTNAPAAGDPVAILEVGAIKVQAVVVEGVGASQTRSGPGHVPGTAGLGQPGNSVVVGRGKAFGGDFAALGNLHGGDQIVVTTTQGQSVYAVDSVHKVALSNESGAAGSIDAIYGPSRGDQLTLVTSASAAPWNRSTARVVVATLQSKPFAPTPQGGRTAGLTGTDGDTGVLASVFLALVAYGVVLGASVLLYRTLRPRTAYVLTVAPIVALTVISAETLSRVFPAWM